MSNISKRIKKIYSKINNINNFDLESILNLIKDTSYVNFLENIDISIVLDIKNLNNIIKDNINLPFNLNKNLVLGVIAEKEEISKIKDYNINYLGINNIINAINNNIKFDLILSSVNAYKNISLNEKIILEKEKIMPSLETNTIFKNILKAVKKIKFNTLLKSDKNGVIHFVIGKINFKNNMLIENIKFILLNIVKNKYIKNKNKIFKNIYLSSTMGISFKLKEEDLIKIISS